MQDLLHEMPETGDNQRMMRWDDETLVVWLQTYPNIKQPLVKMMFRRYKNLIYKEIARQCDHRYDRDDLSQQIILIFMQLLDEYDSHRGIPVAGFLKAKLPNRIYNFFKSQLKLWNTEIPNEDPRRALGEEDEDDGYEISTSTELFDFWREISRCLAREQFEMLYWRFQCEFTPEEIAMLSGLSSRYDVIRGIELALEQLRYDWRLIKQYGHKRIDMLGKHKNTMPSCSTGGAYNAYTDVCREIMNRCGVIMLSRDVIKHLKHIRKIYLENLKDDVVPIRQLGHLVLSLCHMTDTPEVKRDPDTR